MLISPISNTIEYDPGAKHGFYTYPKNSDNQSGWGKPYRDEKGKPIPKPGTSGSKDPIKFIYRKSNKGDWKCSNSPGSQSYGNIDWKGKTIADGKPGRYRLSYMGPGSRYFRDTEFNYGSKDLHNNINYEGYVVAIAPYPVLGACLNKVNEYDEETKKNEDHIYIICICKDQTKDKIYKRRLGLKYKSPVTDEHRTKLMKLYDAVDNKDGWVLLHEQELAVDVGVGDCTIKEAHTPWFFNESGTEAQCIREFDIKFNNNAGGDDVTESGYARFIANIGMSTANIMQKTNEPPYNLVITVKTGDEPDDWYTEKSTKLWEWWRNTTWDSATGKHWWHTYYMEVVMTMKGKQVVAVDYEGDNEILVYARINYVRWMKVFYFLGVDGNYEGNHAEPPNTQDLLTTNNATELTYGLLYNDQMCLDYKNSKYDVNGKLWIYRTLNGNETQYYGITVDEPIWSFFYLSINNQYYHYIDFRDKYLAAYTQKIKDFKPPANYYPSGSKLIDTQRCTREYVALKPPSYQDISTSGEAASNPDDALADFGSHDWDNYNPNTGGMISDIGILFMEKIEEKQPTYKQFLSDVKWPWLYYKNDIDSPANGNPQDVTLDTITSYSGEWPKNLKPKDRQPDIELFYDSISDGSADTYTGNDSEVSYDSTPIIKWLPLEKLLSHKLCSRMGKYPEDSEVRERGFAVSDENQKLVSYEYKDENDNKKTYMGLWDEDESHYKPEELIVCEPPNKPVESLHPIGVN